MSGPKRGTATLFSLRQRIAQLESDVQRLTEEKLFLLEVADHKTSLAEARRKELNDCESLNERLEWGFVVVDVGCLECGEKTHVIAVCTSDDAATQAMTDYMGLLEVRGPNYFHGGQHEIVVCKVDPRGIEADYDTTDEQGSQS